MQKIREGVEKEMELGDLIYNRFYDSEKLTGCLARYAGRPAIFSPDAPGDDMKGWEGNSQYPKAIYNFDLQANEERHSAGTLSVSILCENTPDAVSPEEIEPTVKECLRDVILTPKGGSPYCFAWAGTDAFTIEDKPGLTIGSEIRFDIMEYPSQETSDPDPVMAANRYIKELYPECIVMGYDRMEEITEASAEKPAVYCRLLSVDKAEETNTVAWMEGRIAVHILCPDAGIRMKMASGIANKMSLDGEIIMLDHSPMTIKKLQANYKSDYLKDGQIFANVRYGLLRGLARGHEVKSVELENLG